MLDKIKEKFLPIDSSFSILEKDKDQFQPEELHIQPPQENRWYGSDPFCITEVIEEVESEWIGDLEEMSVSNTAQTYWIGEELTAEGLFENF